MKRSNDCKLIVEKNWPVGLELYENVLNPVLTNKLYSYIENMGWDAFDVTRIKRHVIHLGYVYPYRRGKLSPLPKSKRTTPEVLQCLANALYEHGILKSKPNQIIINQYLAGESIGDHVDQPDYFGKDVASLSLGSEVKMTFKSVKDRSKSLKLPLKVGSLLVFGGEARYKWTHGISAADTRK